MAVVGPEKDYTKILKEQMAGIEWHGTGVGYGLRSSRLQNLTIQLEGIVSRNSSHMMKLTNTSFSDVLILLHDKAPKAPIMFNYNAESFHWAVERRLPLLDDCTDNPGTDLVINKTFPFPQMPYKADMLQHLGLYRVLRKMRAQQLLFFLHLKLI